MTFCALTRWASWWLHRPCYSRRKNTSYISQQAAAFFWSSDARASRLRLIATSVPASDRVAEAGRRPCGLLAETDRDRWPMRRKQTEIVQFIVTVMNTEQCTQVEPPREFQFLQNTGKKPFHFIFTTRCSIVQSAVLRSHVVCPSVCLYRLWRWCIMISWKSWKLIARTISSTSSLIVTQRSSIYSQGNMKKFWGENVCSTPTSITSGWIESTESHVILGKGLAVCLLLSAHCAVIFAIAQLSCFHFSFWFHVVD